MKRILFMMLCAVAVLALVGTASDVMAEDDLPKFVSIASGKVNMRTGPGQRYPIIWVYSRRGLPVEVINTFDTWRKIKDVQGDEGWVHQAMISDRRYGIIQEQAHKLYNKASKDGLVIAELKPGVMPLIEQCTDNWCEIQVEGMQGWVEKPALWGVYTDETFE